MKRIVTSLLALASAAVLTGSAQAATVVAGPGDLILGFRATDGQGSGLNLEVNLGAVSTFYNAAPGSMLTLSGVKVQDLVDTYGANWFSRTDLYWGFAAWYSNAEEDPNGKPEGTQWVSDVDGTAPNRRSFSSQANAGVAIGGLYSGGPGQLGGATSTANSPTAAVIDKTLQGAWSYQLGSGNSFALYNPKIDADIGTVKTLTLVEMQPYAPNPKIPGDVLGSFTFSESGLSFEAVPEPTSAMLVALGLGLSVLLRRRKAGVV